MNEERELMLQLRSITMCQTASFLILIFAPIEQHVFTFSISSNTVNSQSTHASSHRGNFTQRCHKHMWEQQSHWQSPWLIIIISVDKFGLNWLERRVFLHLTCPGRKPHWHHRLCLCSLSLCAWILCFFVFFYKNKNKMQVNLHTNHWKQTRC